MTVARVFSGRGYVSPETREKVLAAARKLNYRPNPLARGLRGGSTGSIGVIWQLLHPEMNAKMAGDIVMAIRQRSHTPYLIPQTNEQETLLPALDDLHLRGVDGLVMQIAPKMLAQPEVQDALSVFPVLVIVTMRPVEIPCDLIVHDRRPGFREAAEYFVSQGRKRLGFLGGRRGNNTKFQAYSSVANEHADVSVEMIGIEGEQEGITGLDAVRTLDSNYADSDLPFDAILAANDELAMALMHWLRQKQISVPDTIAVSGVNDSDICDFQSPPLASIIRRDDEVLTTALEMLYQRLENPKGPREVKTINMTFQPRESAG